MISAPPAKQYVYCAGPAVAGAGGYKSQNFVPLSQPALHMCLENRTTGARSQTLAVNHANASEAPCHRLRDELTQLHSSLGSREAVQVRLVLDSEAATAQSAKGPFRQAGSPV